MRTYRNDVQPGLCTSIPALLFHPQHSSQNDAFEYKPDHVIPVMLGEEFDAVFPAGHIVYQPIVITYKWSQVACY